MYACEMRVKDEEVKSWSRVSDSETEGSRECPHLDLRHVHVLDLDILELIDKRIENTDGAHFSLVRISQLGDLYGVTSTVSEVPPTAPNRPQRVEWPRIGDTRCLHRVGRRDLVQLTSF